MKKSKTIWKDLTNGRMDAFDIEKSNLSYAEKVANMLSMLALNLYGGNTGRGSSYNHRNYMSSDFDHILGAGVEDIIKDIEQNPDDRRIRSDSLRNSNHVLLAKFNFRDESTELYCKNYVNPINPQALEDVFEDSKKVDLVAPFTLLTVPFYNVSQISLIQGVHSGDMIINFSAQGRTEISYDPKLFGI